MKNVLFLFCFFLTFISCKKNNDVPVNPTVDSLKVGLIAYYPFNNNANDESGNHYNLTIHAALPDTDRFGNAGKAYYFEGNIARMDMPVLINADSLREFTISFWVKAKEQYGGAVLSFLPLDKGPIGSSYVSVGLSTPSNYVLYSNILVFDNDYQIGFVPSYSTFENTTGKWTHYVMVQHYNTQFTPGYTYSHFQNNVKFDPRFEGASGDNPMPVSFSYGGSVGCEAFWRPDVNISYRGYFAGSIDDIRIYNRALSDNEVEKLYQLKE